MEYSGILYSYSAACRKRKKINDYDTADDNTKIVDVLLVMTGS